MLPLRYADGHLRTRVEIELPQKDDEGGRRPHLLEVVQRFESRGGVRASDRRHVALRAVERVLSRHRLGGTGSARRLAAACLLGIARAAILHHAPNERPEATAGRLVGLYLRGIGPTGSVVSRRQRGAA